jgi:hypothetical protein
MRQRPPAWRARSYRYPAMRFGHVVMRRCYGAQTVGWPSRARPEAESGRGGLAGSSTRAKRGPAQLRLARVVEGGLRRVARRSRVFETATSASHPTRPAPLGRAQPPVLHRGKPASLAPPTAAQSCTAASRPNLHHLRPRSHAPRQAGQTCTTCSRAAMHRASCLTASRSWRSAIPAPCWVHGFHALSVHRARLADARDR